MNKEKKTEETSLSKYESLIELFVKNSTLSLYESIEDFLDDHTFLVDVEEKIKKTLVDDDHVSCQLFENLQSTRKKIINNMEIYEDDLGIDKVRVKSAISKTFFKVVLKPKEKVQNE
jgi:hypothetical protein